MSGRSEIGRAFNRLSEALIEAASACQEIAAAFDRIIAETPGDEDTNDEPVFADLWEHSDGWYYVDRACPDEGGVGPFKSTGEAIEHAREAGYVVRVEARRDATP